MDAGEDSHSRVHTSFANAPTFATRPCVACTSITSAGTSIASARVASARVASACVTSACVTSACVASACVTSACVTSACVAGAYVGTDVNRADIDGLTYLKLHSGNVLVPT